MKRIVLGLSVLLMLVQNGFAETDAEYDKQIENEEDIKWKQIYSCNKAANNHMNTSSVATCLNAIDIANKNSYMVKEGLSISVLFLNAGVLYYGQGDKLNAYKYFMKSAKLGNITAQKNLNIICKESPWACK